MSTLLLLLSLLCCCRAALLAYEGFAPVAHTYGWGEPHWRVVSATLASVAFSTSSNSSCTDGWNGTIGSLAQSGMRIGHKSCDLLSMVRAIDRSSVEVVRVLNAAEPSVWFSCAFGQRGSDIDFGCGITQVLVQDYDELLGFGRAAMVRCDDAKCRAVVMENSSPAVQTRILAQTATIAADSVALAVVRITETQISLALFNHAAVRTSDQFDTKSVRADISDPVVAMLFSTHNVSFGFSTERGDLSEVRVGETFDDVAVNDLSSILATKTMATTTSSTTTTTTTTTKTTTTTTTTTTASTISRLSPATPMVMTPSPALKTTPAPISSIQLGTGSLTTVMPTSLSIVVPTGSGESQSGDSSASMGLSDTKTGSNSIIDTSGMEVLVTGSAATAITDDGEDRNWLWIVIGVAACVVSIGIIGAVVWYRRRINRDAALASDRTQSSDDRLESTRGQYGSTALLKQNANNNPHLATYNDSSFSQLK
jgi:hypothetical protein